jgi:signal transduction histidine kinase
MFDLLPYKTARKYLESNRSLIESGGRRVYEDTFLMAGGPKTFLIVDQCLRDEAGHNFAIQSSAIDITERKKNEEKAREFPKSFLFSIENERRRISSELYHDIGAMAVGLSDRLDAVEEDIRSGNRSESLQALKSVRKMFYESMTHLKNMAVQIRPPELDILGLRPSLREYCAQMESQRAVRIRFRDSLGRRRVEGETATVLFRIAQESIANAVKHGCAKEVRVSLGSTQGQVAMTIRDNGKCFEPSNQKSRTGLPMGLHLIREMTAAIGGRFAVDSKLGMGTVIRVELPSKAL